MKKILLLIVILLTVGCTKVENKDNKENKDITNIKEETNTLKVIIDKDEYIVTLEDNETVNKLLDLLPLELNMNELNGNEKYVYLDTSLPTNSYNPKNINIGDVMLFGDNCLVIFYKSFETQYSYTKIGHIDNFKDLGNKNIKVKLIN